MSKATVNFGNVDREAMKMLCTCQLAIRDRALAYKALQARRDVLKADGVTDKKAINEGTEAERKHHSACNERVSALCTGFILRYVGTEDAIGGNLYHFDMEAFLRNIGVLTGEDVDKKAAGKVAAVRDMVVDRVKNGIAQLKKGDEVLTIGEDKVVKNTPAEVVAAIIYAGVASGAWEYAGGGVVVKDFSKK